MKETVKTFDQIKQELKDHDGDYTCSRLTHLLKKLVSIDFSTATASFASRIIGQNDEKFKLPEKRTVFFTSFTFEPVLPFLKIQAFLNGFKLAAKFVPYNQWQLSLSDYKTNLEDFSPTDIVLFLHADDVLPQIAQEFIGSSEQNLEETSRDFTVLLESLLKTFRTNCSANIVFSELLLTRSREVERNFAFTKNDNRRLLVQFLNQES